MDKSFKVDILNFQPVDGNSLALHMIRVIRKDIEMRTVEVIKDNESNTQSVKAGLLESMK